MRSRIRLPSASVMNTPAGTRVCIMNLRTPILYLKAYPDDFAIDWHGYI